jgi:hypothetical protein
VYCTTAKHKPEINLAAWKSVLAILAALTIRTTAVAAEPGAGIDSPRYLTPLECPGFAKPQFISRPLTRAYPGLEYSIPPAMTRPKARRRSLGGP